MSTLTVGAGKQFSTIHAAVAASHDGDVVAIDAGTYTNDFATINTKITLQGVGGMAKLVATQSPPDGKAILTTNTDVTLDHLDMSGAKVADANGAAVRFQGGNLTISNSAIHDNQDGILGGKVPGGTVTIENSDIHDNGTGTGYTHNVYVGEIDRLTVRDSSIHDVAEGHQIKSRAHETVLTGNHIYDGDSTASYSVDLPNGGKATLEDNVIQQGANSHNPAIVAFGEEGHVYGGSQLTMTGNTVVDDAGSHSIMVRNDSSATAEVRDTDTVGIATSEYGTGPLHVSGTTPIASADAAVAAAGVGTQGGGEVFRFDQGFGHDTVQDFTATGPGHDLLDISGLGITAAEFDTAVSVTQAGQDVHIGFAGTADDITVLGATASNIDSADFIFA